MLGLDHRAVAGLKEALRQARLQAQVPPVHDRIQATKMFIERSRKRVDSAREEITKAQAAVLEAQAKLTKEEEPLEDGLQRLISLQQEADGLSEQQPPPTAQVDFAHELAQFEGLRPGAPSREGRSSNGASQADWELGRSSEECQVDRWAVTRSHQGRQFVATIGVSDQVWPQPIQCDGNPHRPGRFECQVEPSFQSDVVEWHLVVTARYGL